jgi:prolyl-tRNA editing enzyme YbaK/EbsC (Cys-tRNA(Pro) deacylase)
MSKSILDPKVQQALEQSGIIYKVLECDPELADTAAFCAHYNLPVEQAANTIVVSSRKVDPVKYAVCVKLAPPKLDVNKKVCQLLGVKKASFADAEVTKELTGMMIGGVTAIGITDWPIYVDSAVMEQDQVVMGGGNRSSKILLNPNELTKLKNVQIVEGLSLAH